MTTATLVPEDRRENFFIDKFGNAGFLVEAALYARMSELVPEYNGAYWEFYELSNNGFYFAPRHSDDRKYHMIVPTNGYEGDLSPDAAGIVVSLFILNALCWELPSEEHNRRFYALQNYAFNNHPEAMEIIRAID